MVFDLLFVLQQDNLINVFSCFSQSVLSPTVSQYEASSPGMQTAHSVTLATLLASEPNFCTHTISSLFVMVFIFLFFLPNLAHFLEFNLNTLAFFLLLKSYGV